MIINIKTYTMETPLLLEKILAAKSLQDILDINNLDKEFDLLIKQIHPDRCSLPKAHEATCKLNELRNVFKKGKVYGDDVGEYRTNGFTIHFSGDIALLKKSLDMYRQLKSRKDTASLHFHTYLPEHMEIKGNILYATLSHRAIPLSQLQLPQEHVNWILSRMLECVAWFAQIGYVHAGLTPESVFVVPETHGIIIPSFYHMTPLGRPLKTISGRYQHWYPASTFDKKIAQELIDIELAKKVAIYLSGDPSGSGVRLKKTHHPQFVDFVVRQHDNSFTAFTKYRALLDKYFEKKFYPLNV